MSALEEEFLALAKELLEEFGMPVTITSGATTGFDPVTLKPTRSDTSFDGLAVGFDPANSNMSGFEQETVNDATKSRRWFYVVATQSLTKGCVIITKSGSEYSVEQFSELKPTDLIIYSRVQTVQIK